MFLVSLLLDVEIDYPYDRFIQSVDYGNNNGNNIEFIGDAESGLQNVITENSMILEGPSKSMKNRKPTR